MESEPEIINLESTCTVCRFRPDGSFLFKALDELGNLGIGKTLTLAQVPGPNGVEGVTIQMHQGDASTEPTVSISSERENGLASHQMALRLKLTVLQKASSSSDVFGWQSSQSLEKSLVIKGGGSGSSHLGAMSKRGKRQSTRHGDGGTFEVLWTNWNRLVLADPTPVKILVVVEGRSQRNTSTASSLLDMTTVSSFSTSLSRSFKSKSSDISSVIETGSILSDMAKEFEEQKLANRWILVLEGGADEGDARTVSLPFNQTLVELRSPVLAASVREGSEFKEGEKGEIDFRNVWSMEATKEMLRYVYTDDVEKLGENACELLQMSHLYELDGLFDRCQWALLDVVRSIGCGSEEVDVETLTAIYILAFRFCGSGTYIGLYEAALNEIAFRLYEAKRTESWKRLETDKEAFEEVKRCTSAHPEWLLM